MTFYDTIKQQAQQLADTFKDSVYLVNRPDGWNVEMKAPLPESGLEYMEVKPRSK